ncbi:Tyrosine-protein kinase [Trema orientale]|uniref:non-specific serine/threonine protein kinase n=1 Tax=Trema orientale TaxID=63057 RepID=A0A2P5EM74_TREOI|nr:Tyrosine-protein kinase [Trema orientale]
MSNQLVLLNRSKTIVWSLSPRKRVAEKLVLAQLLDTGNLDSDSKATLIHHCHKSHQKGQKRSTEWAIVYQIPYQPCDTYGYSGANGICRAKGCKKKVPLDYNKGEGFLEAVGVKLPDLLEFWLNKNMRLKECEEKCFKNCSCIAYANSDIRSGGSGCLMWFGDLIDVREIHVKGSEQAMYIRLSASEMKSIEDANKKKRGKIIIVVVTVSGHNKNEDIELSLFDFGTVATATNNFSHTRMIGEGGFGPIYKGSLPIGQEIAVKRPSKNSGQATQEFKNEVVLIAKLQHKNLVGLLGCCIQGEERMLIYKYMCNKSLDHFIFEYAIDGKFSVKSDVFSFDVVLLEIISGRRNSGFSHPEHHHDHPEHHHNLLGHASPFPMSFLVSVKNEFLTMRIIIDLRHGYYGMKTK